MTLKRREALMRRAKRILAALLVSLNKGAMMSKRRYDFDQMDIGHLLRCIQHRMDYLKTGPWKHREHGMAEAIAEMADLTELQSRLVVGQASPKVRKAAR